MNNLLPVKKGEFFEVRFHSIGGQGAYTIGKMIATIASYKDEIKSSVFATYGSEKKGAPVSVFIRMLESDNKIENYSAVKEPSVVVVFHEQLLKTIDVLDGLKEDGLIIINTDLSPQEVVDKYKLAVGNVMTIDATKYALEAKAKVNTVVFGSIMSSLESFYEDEGLQEIEAQLAYKYPTLVKANQDAYSLGFNNSTLQEGLYNKDYEKEFKTNLSLGYTNQYIGGTIKGANAYKVDRSISREGYVPLFDQGKCINCTKCDLTCPDDCFIWKEQEGRRGRMEMVLQGIDYNLCKGCLRCVKVCPTDALQKEVETREFVKNNNLKKYEEK